jgi:hypothetical protein
LDPRRRTYSLDRSIKCFGTSWAPGSKANPRRAGPLTPPGNHIPVLFDQPALCCRLRHYAGAVREGRCQFHDTVPPTPVPPSRRPPQKRTVAPSKGVRPPTLHPPGPTPWRKAGGAGLPSHFQPCVVIPAIVLPSRALQRHPQHCGNPGRRDIATPAAARLPIFRQPSPRIGVHMATKHGLHRYYP